MAIIDRVSTFALFQTTLSNIAGIDGKIANLQNQLSSGLKSQDFAGIASQSSQFLQLDDRLSRTDQYLANNNVIKVRLNSTDTVLTQVINTATQLKNLVLQRRSETNNVGVFGTQIEALWKTLAGQLNTTVDGRYIFSGGRTDIPAVNTTDFPQIQNEDTLETGFYQGDSSDLNVRVSDNIDLVYNIRANEDGFQKIFSGLALAAQGDASNSDEQLAQAFDLINQGIRGVITVQAKNNSNIVEVNNIEDNLTQLRTYWLGIKEEIGNADLIGASTQVAINQSILQAAFQSFARINSLRLSDFLG